QPTMSAAPPDPVDPTEPETKAGRTLRGRTYLQMVMNHDDFDEVEDGSWWDNVARPTVGARAMIASSSTRTASRGTTSAPKPLESPAPSVSARRPRSPSRCTETRPTNGTRLRAARRRSRKIRSRSLAVSRSATAGAGSSGFEDAVLARRGGRGGTAVW